MKKDETWVLGELVASSDNEQTLRAQLVEATVVRPDALQEIQRTVMMARNSGQVDEASATRILFQVDLLVETTRVLGVEPTRLREVPEQRFSEIAKTQVRMPPVARQPAPQDHAPTQRLDYQPTQRIDRPAQTPDYQPTQRIDSPPTQRLDFPATQRIDRPAQQPDYPATQRIDRPPQPDYPATQRIDRPPAQPDYPPTQRIDRLPQQPEFPPTQRLDRPLSPQDYPRTLQVQQTEAIPAQAAQVAAAAQAGTAPMSAAMSAMDSAMTERTRSAGGRNRGVSLVTGAVLKDRFVLKREIGRGGMGAVFAAEDLRKVEANDPEPMVAVKVLAPDFARHPVAFVALQRESRRAQTLAHPNVATVFDFDRDGDLVFMTMELLSGKPLDGVIRETEGKGLPRAKALAILIDITRGLAYAHRKGLVHADLKPGNIFLADNDVPKILDFGIARAVPGHTVAKKDSFDAGALGAYTPAYATTEMIEGGDPHTADDVYALGIIAYELFTGKHPYQRLSGQVAERRKLIPAPIKGLSRRHWSVIERSLSFDRKRRPVDASAFLKGLFGVTPLQQALIATAAVLACVAIYFGYARYQAAGPDVPFSQLSQPDQQAFQENMREGNTAWNFYTQQNVDDAWQTALSYYADAWKIHPRNREASEALRNLARRVLDTHPDNAAEVAVYMGETSPYLKDYGPVRERAAAAETTAP